MNPPVKNRGLRRMIVGGILMLCFGGCFAATGDGFGGPPPPIAESMRTKRIGIAIAIAGIVLSIGSAIRLYIVEKE